MIVVAGADRRMLAAHATDRIRSDLAYFPTRGAARRNGSQSRPVLLVAALSAFSWNFLFIPPLFTLHIAKLEDALTFATYFIIAITVGSLTAQLKAREHLAAQVQLAQESERLRKTLLDCVSHELKTPLAAIGAASQELSRLDS